jgi:hypothetical protein
MRVNPGHDIATRERWAAKTGAIAGALGGIGIAGMIKAAWGAKDLIQAQAYEAATNMVVNNPEFVVGGGIAAIGVVAGGASVALRESARRIYNQYSCQ